MKNNMRKNPLSGWKQVFAFTLDQQVRSRGYIASTVTIALVLVLLIPALMLVTDQIASSDEKPGDTAITRIVLVDETGANWQALSAVQGLYADIPMELASSLEDAAQNIGATEVLVHVSGDAQGISVQALTADETEISADDAQGCADFVAQNLRAAQLMASGLTLSEMAQIFAPVGTEIASNDGEEERPGGMAADLIEMLLPFAVMMFMYFLILVYGQSVANSVIAEKTSKLMDVMLLSTRPAAMMLGKLLAIALTGLTQFGLWVLGAVVGCYGGVQLVKLVNPDSAIGIVVFLDFVTSAGEMFSPAGVIMGVALAAGGFLLYCALSAFGGALAGKPEDLSSTNMFFTLILMASYFAVVFTGTPETGMVSDAAWSVFVPFTSILVQPGRLMMGQTPVWLGLVSLAIVLVTAFALTLLAGKTYTLCAFRKGDPVKPTQLVKLFRDN